MAFSVEKIYPEHKTDIESRVEALEREMTRIVRGLYVLEMKARGELEEEMPPRDPNEVEEEDLPEEIDDEDEDEIPDYDDEDDIPDGEPEQPVRTLD
jgi:hypothetical protein